MTRAIKAALAFGLVAASAAPAFADCAGHMAEGKSKPVVTADTTGTQTPVSTDKKG